MARILVIDDHDEFQSMLCELLRKAGHEVTGASDGNEGILLGKKLNLDLVITDIIMPNKEGMETIIEFKKLLPNLPIIAISGGGRGDPQNYLKGTRLLSNVKYTFAKPLETDKLLQAIDDLVGKEL
ncbi:MAG: hypothetical protein A2Y03_00840 [Omnitrophica WOR_2 bacterium GWF2_38_59]|nr:MAG: hypothetical protein A2Y06_03535 [Omnitrophica WOR_2 bacterium GWA2_37_7]OGX23990.1 MAG: hypothetical protein A2Y03_00840 [Omnitrophica WOR_2 bacterium GWF2_38_59]OGX46902.1 MAG: hypothetical protein A2243_11960 [Omnitrophica WOR_2 bacterium RIFOXYA2_FULL_38_17]OGX52590.1 MAG: hypothetical protein A2267_03730 [Omnitrophica WOR_2 bacterium RIFOXYA12_FULL_38_10]OGX56484.1 MAG: hypothetical protein A2447_10145 [Omnitrophica WOR_2 bacterium RIFOXYC2_FULL_38_12]OGX58521.1 MAG: hypothetical 